MDAYQNQVLYETSNMYFNYPPTLPKDRGCEAQWWTYIFVALIFSGGVYKAFEEKPLDVLEVVCHISSSCYLILIGIVEVLQRVAFLMEERHHIRSRYNGSQLRLFQHTFSLDWISCFLFTSCIVFLFWIRQDDLLKYVYEIGPKCWICVIIAVQLVMRESKLLLGCSAMSLHCRLLKYFIEYSGAALRGRVSERGSEKKTQSKVAKSIMMEAMSPLDYGSGMAYNFFYGYLRIVLPNMGNREKGLLERISDYISVQRLEETSFPVHKLFILIPASSYSPTNLSEVSDDWMQAANSLEKQVRNRAGVIERVYKNSVYKIENPNNLGDDPVYVVAEAATPLKTLYEVVQHSGVQQDFFKEHYNTIIFNFYKSLKTILKNDRDCRDLCELIYYEDTDENGDVNVNVGHIILDRIEILRGVAHLQR